MKHKLKYFIPVFGLIYPYLVKDGLLNDMGDDAFKLAWVLCHITTTLPLMVLLEFMIILTN